MGAPRLQEWMASTVAIFTTAKISSRVAPACSAARIWRRVPSGLRWVQAAFSATPISSMVLRGSTLPTQGLVDIWKQASAHCGSHSLSLSRDLSHGPIPGRRVDELPGLIGMVMWCLLACRQERWYGSPAD